MADVRGRAEKGPVAMALLKFLTREVLLRVFALLLGVGAFWQAARMYFRWGYVYYNGYRQPVFVPVVVVVGAYLVYLGSRKTSILGSFGVRRKDE